MFNKQNGIKAFPLLIELSEYEFSKWFLIKLNFSIIYINLYIMYWGAQNNLNIFTVIAYFC